MSVFFLASQDGHARTSNGSIAQKPSDGPETIDISLNNVKAVVNYGMTEHTGGNFRHVRRIVVAGSRGSPDQEFTVMNVTATMNAPDDIKALDDLGLTVAQTPQMKAAQAATIARQQTQAAALTGIRQSSKLRSSFTP